MGEWLLAFGYGSVLIVSGLWVGWRITRDYED